jgi:hypothetical protein
MPAKIYKKKLQGVKVLNIPQEVKEMIPGGKAKKHLETS